ncbi:MAG TPA: hypothetical protein PLP13_07280, partial [bacterium]|nr:hypothetical protein [bacterium]
MRTVIIVGTVVAGFTIAIFAARFHASLYGEFQPPGTLVEIPKNLMASDVAVLLKEKGIIKNTRLFLKVLNRNHTDRKLRSGIYEFSGKPYIYDVIQK